MASVSFKKATRLYPGGTRPAVDQIELEVADGEFLVLVGPSGCGKSTTLRMLAGLEEVNEGDIFIGDRNVTDVPPKDRDIAMVFQNYALYPHMTVAENMGFALKIAGVSKEERAERVLEAAKLLEESNKIISEKLFIKESLMTELAVWIEEKDLKQSDAALILGVTRLRVSDVINKKSVKFTIDALVDMLARTGKQVQITVQ